MTAGPTAGSPVAPAWRAKHLWAVIRNDTPQPNRVVPPLLWGAMIASAMALGQYATGSGVGLLPADRGFPRMPDPPPDLRALLFQLGVGSVLWYVAVVSLPVLILAARRLDADRLGQRSTVLALVVLIGGALVTSLLQYVTEYHGAPIRPGLAHFLPFALRQNLLPWMAFVAIAAGVEWRRRALRSVVERERLRAELAEQQLMTGLGSARARSELRAGGWGIAWSWRSRTTVLAGPRAPLSESALASGTLGRVSRRRSAATIAWCSSHECWEAWWPGSRYRSGEPTASSCR